LELGILQLDWTGHATVDIDVKLTNYSFNLDSLSYADISSYNGLYSFSLMGHGTANVTGYDATQGNFVIGASGQNLSFQFISGSGTANGTVVPDSGSTVALSGFALIASLPFAGG
jgi:hypothetical protein